ncbi:efflux RND transporter periplasmic adaptor subunit [Erwinia mallotivora]|uniref:efflux RND transporter periplasmic adaptor subunit n=1 Tax=Erwinia mallotivora TaxID=69222 RepID=UPI0021C0E669|nr:efflux RND transporter periplasmic adaptor subunit [Erwinia mallotivora]
MKQKARLTLFLLLPLLAGAAGFWLGRQQEHGTPAASPQTVTDRERQILYWYDPMSPATRFDKPGKSPFMDMDLVPRYASETDNNEGVIISARQQQNLGIRTAKVTRQPAKMRFSASGTIATDQQHIEVIPALTSGVVEKLYVSAPQQWVKKGQALAQIWHPQWAAAQQEYLAVRRLGDASLSAAARQRLALQFMQPDLIREAERRGTPQLRISVRAPYDGYINQLGVRKGAQVSAGQSLFELATLDPVWLVIDYAENQASLLSRGSSITATSLSWPGQQFHGRVSELLPDLASATRTLQARVVMENPHHQLKPGMYLSVGLAEATAMPAVLTMPEEALIVTGSSNQVLVSEGEGHFHPVTVTTGFTQDGRVEILSGLDEGTEVVTSGQFLIDSEASLRSALPQMSSASASPSSPTATYATRGVIKAINTDSITIAHQPVAELNWAAMTMDFIIDSGQKQSLTTGQQVMFSFTLGDEGARITSIMPVRDNRGQP